MAAGITGRCSWVWMCQGKILGKPLPEKVVAEQLLGLWEQQGLSLDCWGKGQW